MLQRIAAANGGRLTPRAVVAAASNPASPLHACFEWDDTAAGRKYREGQARTLIASVKIEVVINEIAIPGPFFVHDPRAGNEQGYIAITRVRTDRERAVEVVAEAVAQATSAIRRAQAVACLVGLSRQVGSVQRQLVAMSEQLAEAA